MRRVVFFAVSLISILLLGAAVHADAPTATLIANGRAEYRFDYRGDRTPIEIALDAPGVQDLELLIYTPAQIEAAQHGQPLVPVGRGTPGKNHELFWTGNFPAPGAYRVTVVNHSAAPILYRLEITGPSVSAVAQLVNEVPQSTGSLSNENGTRILTVNLPPGSGASQLRLGVPGAPAQCTHANQIPPILSSSIKLCPNEIYPPLHLVGNNLALYADDAHSAIVTSAGRQFAITIEGSNNLVEGVTIQASADPVDAGAFLCLYADCVFPTQPRETRILGGTIYGGGILLKGSNSTVHSVTVHGGTIGIATLNGRANYIVDNRLSDLNGWGSFNVSSIGSYFVGNILNRDNHPCKTPDGRKFEHGCETAGWVCLACSSNVIARNHCESSGNCFYMSGERGLGSNNNKLIANYCAGATDNCFELTFSRGNLLQDNVTTADRNTGGACKYPFWIGGSTVYFKNNTWECAISASEALDHARASTQVLTSAIFLSAADNFTLPTATPTPTVVARTPVSRTGNASPTRPNPIAAATATPTQTRVPMVTRTPRPPPEF